MANCDVLVLDDCEDEPYTEDTFGQDIEQAIANLADPSHRKAALEALLSHPYAADDLLCSAAWPAFRGLLPSLLLDPDAETAAAAVAFADSVLRELRAGSPQQLAHMCMALAAAHAAHAGHHLASLPQAAGAAGPPQHGHQPQQGNMGAPGSGMRQRGHSEAGNGAARAHVRAGLTRLLLRSLQALPKVWASFRPPLMQELWDAVCPLLRLPGSSTPVKAARADPLRLEGPAVQPARSAEGASSRRLFTSATAPASAGEGGAAEGMLLAEAAAPAQRCPSTASGPMPPTLPAPAPGPAACAAGGHDAAGSPAPEPILAELCAAEEQLGAWWGAWTAPAASCRWLPGSLERHGVLPGLLDKCRELAAQGSRGEADVRPEEAFAVQVVGTVLLLSQGRRLFPVALTAAGGEPRMQASVPCAVSWLVAIAARGGPAGAGARQPDLAACAARDALRLLLRDDSDHFRILCAPNVAELLQLQAALQAQQPHCNTSASSTRRCVEEMLAMLARTAYGRQLLSQATSTLLQAC